MIALDTARLRRLARGLPDTPRAPPSAPLPPPDKPDKPDDCPSVAPDSRVSRDSRPIGRAECAPAAAGAGQVAAAVAVALVGPGPAPALALLTAAPLAPVAPVAPAAGGSDVADNPPPWSRRYAMRQAGDPAWRCPPPLDFSYADWPALRTTVAAAPAASPPTRGVDT